MQWKCNLNRANALLKSPNPKLYEEFSVRLNFKVNLLRKTTTKLAWVEILPDGRGQMKARAQCQLIPRLCLHFGSS